MIQGESWQVHIGNNLDILPTLDDNSIDSIVTDPPYELGFMGKKWDSSGIAYNTDLWKECLRVLKPGGHLLSFGGTRTWHRVAVAIEDAGFEVRDMIAWISNKTFPKSLNIEKATQSDEWNGWGTALKPTVEPIVMSRKPLIGTVAENVLTYGTGGLNIDGSRIGTESITINTFDNGAKPFGDAVGEPYTARQSQGRWPANVILDEYTAEILDEQSGMSKSPSQTKTTLSNSVGYGFNGKTVQGHGDSGGASRFFYVAKASKRDRNEGLDTLPINRPDTRSSTGMGTFEEKGGQPQQNFHPTVKPTALMRYLVKLVTPPNGTVLDPFTGSGSTGKAAIFEGFQFIGIELTEDYIPIIEGRLNHAEKQQEPEGLF